MKRKKNYIILQGGLSKRVPCVMQGILTIVGGDRLPTPAAIQTLMDLLGEIKKARP